MSRYELRKLLWSWGLMVDLGLSVQVVDDRPSVGIPVAPGAWLEIAESANLWEGDLPNLVRGLRRVAPRFQATLAAGDGEIVFVLDHLWYPLTDFQDDAVELAVAGWASEVLELPGEPAKVSFDRLANRYLIEFKEDIW